MTNNKRKKIPYITSPLGLLEMCPLSHDYCEVTHQSTKYKVPLSSDLRWASGGKMGAVKVKLDGHTFHSAREARRYSKLKFLESQKVIADVQIQPPFPIIINEIRIKTVFFDFAYNYQGRRYFEDVKGHKTEIFKLNWKLVHALYPACKFCII